MHRKAKVIYVSAKLTAYNAIDVYINRLRAEAYAYEVRKQHFEKGELVGVICPHEQGSHDATCMNYDGWMAHCLALLERCDEMHVLRYADEETYSNGVREEIAFAERLKIPIKFIKVI